MVHRAGAGGSSTGIWGCCPITISAADGCRCMDAAGPTSASQLRSREPMADRLLALLPRVNSAEPRRASIPVTAEALRKLHQKVGKGENIGHQEVKMRNGVRN